MILDNKPIIKLFDYLPKSGRKAGDGNGEGKYPYFTSGQVQSKFIDFFDYEGNCLVLGTGGKASIHFASNKFSATNDCFVLKPKDNKKVISKYVYYYLAGRIPLLERGFRGAGLKHLSRQYLNDLSIPLLNPDEQVRIVSILDEANVLRKKRTESIKLLDDYLKSIFFEMFGDPYHNENKYSIETISSLLTERKNSIRTGPFGSQLKHSEFTKNGVPVLGIDNIVKNKFNENYKRFLPEEKVKEFERYIVQPDDLIITIMGTTGKVAVAPKNLEKCMSTKHLCVLTLNKEKINSTFLWATLIFDKVVRNQTKKQAAGAIMEGWNMSIIKSLRVRVPQIEFQQEFEDVVENINNLKEKYKKSEKELDNLFGSLSQKAFKGEL